MTWRSRNFNCNVNFFFFSLGDGDEWNWEKKFSALFDIQLHKILGRFCHMLQDADYRKNPNLWSLPFHFNFENISIFIFQLCKIWILKFFHNKLIAKKYVNTTSDFFFFLVEKSDIYIIFSSFQITYTLSSFAAWWTTHFLALKMRYVVF